MKKRTFNILVAEDDPAISTIVTLILRHLGHHVDPVRDGKEAILRFSAAPGFYDILITDHDMPEINGLQLVQHLRKNDFAGKIIVMSGSLTEDLMQAYRARRVHKILQKPFSKDILTATLSGLLTQWNEEHHETAE